LSVSSLQLAGNVTKGGAEFKIALICEYLGGIEAWGKKKY